MWLILAAVTLLTTFLSTNRRYRWIYILAKTYRRDIKGGLGYARLNILLWFWGFRNKTVASIFSSLAKKHPQKIAFYYENDVWTFAEAEKFSNKVGRYFKQQGFKKGDHVALLLENRPEYPCIWIGLSKVGVVTALINTNLVSDPLLHSIKVSDCTAVIFGTNHAEPIRSIVKGLESMKLYQFHEVPKETAEVLPNCKNLRRELKDVVGSPIKTDVQLNIKDPLVYIYTSGTTGLPKAAVITNIRFMFMSMALHCLGGFSSKDIVYNALPLYHTAGGMLGVGQTFLKGMTLAIRKKFSASNYWKDCARYNCTIAQYVGEICRYVLAVPSKEPIHHSVRAIFGNGLRPQIWGQFVRKFNIKNVYEVYGATEGISNLINVDNTVGCVGFVPRYCRWAYPVTLIRCNEITGEPIRNKDGHCIECKVDESGLVIGKIDQRKGVFNFKGYSDKSATEKKVLQNVFRDGDMYFNSGDILVGDEFGNFFFKDRTGDTFRWKGENVSTSEIEGVISNIIQLNDAVVYGVEIPETEGKAGMAAIVDTNKTLNIELLGNGLKANLPSYAVPVFIRVMESVPMTGTYKLKKIELQSEGYNINNIKDSIYFYNSKLGGYVPLSKDIYEQIMAGKLSI